MTRNQTDTEGADVMNGLVAGAFALAVIGIAGVLTLAQFLAVA